MMVSVILCAYTLQRINDLFEVINSISKQSYENIELLIVVDGNYELYKRIKAFISLSELKNIKILLNEKNFGLTYSRNKGIKHASGDIIAFIDDDAIADEHWISNMIHFYRNENVIGVGGKILPLLLSNQSLDMPEELYWIVGATHKGFSKSEKAVCVRNLFGSNMSFRKKVFDHVGLFNENFGRKGVSQLQSEETEFCIRVTRKLRQIIVYNPEAIIYHKVFPERTQLNYILKRSFWQGYSKSILKSINNSNVLSQESQYLREIIFKFYLHSLKNIGKKPVKKIKALLKMTMVLSAVGTGYFYRFMQKLTLH